MTQPISPVADTITRFSWMRTRMVTAAALMVIAMSLPAHAKNANASQSDQPNAPAGTGNANASPVAVTDYVDLENAGQAFNVLANDSDADNDTLSVIDASAEKGAVAFTTDGLIAYAGNSATPQSDEISYVLSDGRGGQAEGKIIVSVR